MLQQSGMEALNITVTVPGQQFKRWNNCGNQEIGEDWLKTRYNISKCTDIGPTEGVRCHAGICLYLKTMEGPLDNKTQCWLWHDHSTGTRVSKSNWNSYRLDGSHDANAASATAAPTLKYRLEKLRCARHYFCGTKKPQTYYNTDTPTPPPPMDRPPFCLPVKSVDPTSKNKIFRSDQKVLPPQQWM